MKGKERKSEKGTDRKDAKGGMRCIEYRLSKIDVRSPVATMHARLFDFMKICIVCVCVCVCVCARNNILCLFFKCSSQVFRTLKFNLL